MNLFAEVLVLAAGTYLVALGVVAFVRPDTVKRFLAAFATSARAHYVELAVRMTIGLALVQAAPRMRMATANMPLLAIGALAGGGLALLSLSLGHGD